LPANADCINGISFYSKAHLLQRSGRRDYSEEAVQRGGMWETAKGERVP
jgi:hypothetical protein